MSHVIDGFFAPSATWKAPLDNIWTLDEKCLSIHPPTSLLLKCDLNKFPICSLSLQHETPHIGEALSDMEGQKGTETRNPDS